MKMRPQQKGKGKVRTVFNLRYLFILIVISIFLASCKDDDDTITSNTLEDNITNQAYVNILKNNLSNLPNNAQVAIALVHNGNTEYLGVSNKNDILQVTNNTDKVFEIGSITKVFTSICLSNMISLNEASLTETLQNQFAFPLLAGDDITLQQLANHTSGIPSLPTNVDEIQGLDIENPYAVYTYDNLKSYLQNHMVLNATSGENYEYSNLATGILGYSLAQKRNSTFDEMLQSIIFNPLGMTSSTTLIENVDASRLVEPRDIEGNIVSHWDFAETMSAAGSVKSSVRDMVKFIRKNFEDNAVYNLPQEATFDRGNNIKMGLGWVVFEDDGFIIHTHDGGTGGFSSILMLDKDKEIGVIVLSNVENYQDTITSMCGDLILEINN
jgi:CubicO group peptidase (beta-lactamase class C family)